MDQEPIFTDFLSTLFTGALGGPFQILFQGHVVSFPLQCQTPSESKKVLVSDKLSKKIYQLPG